MQGEDFIPLNFEQFSESEMLEKSAAVYKEMDKRRTVRFFSDEPVPKEVIQNIIKTASSAPSGAHMQPWTFCVISSPEMKAKIREAAEEEERINYSGRMSDTWLEDLKVFGTDAVKEFITTAPYIIVMFRQAYGMENGKKKTHYYTQESVGIAAGFLLSAIHQSGLAALTHTPSPMNFLNEILDRPSNEKPFLLIPVGLPAKDCTVPKLTRKPLESVAVFYE